MFNILQKVYVKVHYIYIYMCVYTYRSTRGRSITNNNLQYFSFSLNSNQYFLFFSLRVKEITFKCLYFSSGAAIWQVTSNLSTIWASKMSLGMYLVTLHRWRYFCWRHFGRLLDWAERSDYTTVPKSDTYELLCCVIFNRNMSKMKNISVQTCWTSIWLSSERRFTLIHLLVLSQQNYG